MTDHRHQYQASRPVTRPDWPNKHDEIPKARNLLPYILEPEKYPDRVLRNTTDTVLIHDQYPKAQVHLLLLPKWLPHRDMHPHDAFEDPAFLSMVRREVSESLKVATTLLYTKIYDALIKKGKSPADSTRLLSTRDISQDLRVGIHAHPSQHELHVHIISRDMVSWHPYGGRHYQAFNTPFFVPLDVYPRTLDDQLGEVAFQNANLKKVGFECWRCGRNIGRAWDIMLAHLNEEFKEWIAEERSNRDKLVDKVDEGTT